ncbi:hypothetical protein [Streptomyces umbrinus]|uniref:hypothetical protein n=1 Tax=Streptomyces umbrinus TaxID=67370 RepID=UPI00341DAF5C
MTDLVSTRSAEPSDVPDVLEVSLAEVATLRGRTFVGDWLAVDSDRLPAFEHATYLDEGLYPDEDPYPDGLVEGFHLLGLLDRLISGTFRPVPGTVEGWNYGMDRVRFVSPVLAGERMRAHFTVAETEPKGDGQVLLLRCVVEVEGRERPGFTADWRVFWRPAAVADLPENSENTDGSGDRDD